MKSELLLTAIIFILLFLKLGSKEWKTDSLLNFINALLTVNLLAGFFPAFGGTSGITEGKLFGEMFRTNELNTFEKIFSASAR